MKAQPKADDGRFFALCVGCGYKGRFTPDELLHLFKPHVDACRGRGA